jgi:hypothetical protein
MDNNMDVDQAEKEEATHILCLRVNDLQHDTIYNLFGHNDWEFEEVSKLEVAASTNAVRKDDGQIPDKPTFRIAENQEEEECPYCLRRPCITSESNRQFWWEDTAHDAHEWNSGLRKDKYRRFWTMLYHRHAWADPRYIARKNAALLQDPRHRIYAWAGGYHHRRDLMPDCVLKLVRGWFPNPPEKPYMGHRWQ